MSDLISNLVKILEKTEIDSNESIVEDALNIIIGYISTLDNIEENGKLIDV